MIGVRETRPWIPLAAAAAAAVAGAAATLGPLATLPALALLAMAVVLVNPGVGIPVLIAASAMNRVALPWGDAAIRLEIVVDLLLLAVLVNRLAIRRLSSAVLKTPLTWPLVAYFGINLLSTLLFAHEHTRGLKLDAEIGAMVAAFLVIATLVHDRASVERAMQVLWTVTVLEALIGLLSLLAYAAHISSLGVQEGDYGLPMVYGTQWEANIFGSFLLGNFLLLLADTIRKGRTRSRTLGLLVVVAGIAASMTRTVWIALFLGVLLLGVLTLRVRRPGSTFGPILAATPIIVLLGLIVGSATPFAGRLLDLVNLQSSSAHGRLLLFDAAMAEWRSHPLLGLGTGSFNVGAQPGLPHPWLPNLFLLTLHDTGIVGICILIWLLATFYLTVIRGFRGTDDMVLLVAGAIAAFTALLVSFQTTTGFWFAYPWIVAALGLAAARETSRTVAAETPAAT